VSLLQRYKLLSKLAQLRLGSCIEPTAAKRFELGDSLPDARKDDGLRIEAPDEIGKRFSYG
jgi:hypothetical protein